MPGGQDKGWPRGPLTDTAPGPVRFPTYDEIMSDSRRALWHPIGAVPVPTNRDVLLTRLVETNVESFWLLQRHRCNGRDTPYLNGRMATHWAEDIVGTPAGVANKTASA